MGPSEAPSEQPAERGGESDVPHRGEPEKDDRSVQAHDLPRESVEGGVHRPQHQCRKGWIMADQLVEIARAPLRAADDSKDLSAHLGEGGNLPHRGQGAVDDPARRGGRPGVHRRPAGRPERPLSCWKVMPCPSSMDIGRWGRRVKGTRGIPSQEGPAIPHAAGSSEAAEPHGIKYPLGRRGRMC
jgi:hypothetical protein